MKPRAARNQPERGGLQSLRPPTGTTPEEWRRLIDEHGWQALFPQSLSEDLLLATVADLRQIEHSIATDADGTPQLTQILLVLIELLREIPLHENDDQPSVRRISHPNIMEAMRAYQWAIEREVVARITGIHVEHDSVALAEALRAAVLSTGPQ